MMRHVLVALIVLVAPLAAAAVPMTDGDGALYARISLPEDVGAARVLVMSAHGYGHNTTSWVNHLDEFASHGAIGVAVEYGNWEVAKGAAALVDVTQEILVAYPQIDTVVLFAVSMGGSMAGVALQTEETKPDGSPLFDYFLAAEAVSNLAETYAEANAAALAAPIAANTVREIDAECGGGPAAPDCLAARSFALHARTIAARGLEGAWVVHDINDGLVPYNQGVETFAAFTSAGIPTSFTTVVRSAQCGAEVGTTATGYARAQDVGCLAGHSSEASSTQAVMRASLDTVNAYLDTRAPPETGVHIWDSGAFLA